MSTDSDEDYPLGADAFVSLPFDFFEVQAQIQNNHLDNHTQASMSASAPLEGGHFNTIDYDDEDYPLGADAYVSLPMESNLQAQNQSNHCGNDQIQASMSASAFLKLKRLNTINPNSARNIVNKIKAISQKEAGNQSVTYSSGNLLIIQFTTKQGHTINDILLIGEKEIDPHGSRICWAENAATVITESGFFLNKTFADEMVWLSSNLVNLYKAGFRIIAKDIGEALYKSSLHEQHALITDFQIKKAA